MVLQLSQCYTLNVWKVFVGWSHDVTCLFEMFCLTHSLFRFVCIHSLAVKTGNGSPGGSRDKTITVQKQDEP